MKTVFKKIIDGEIPSHKVYEDEDHLAFLDIFPYVKGHTLIIPKKEYVNIVDMPEDEYIELQRLVHRFVKHYTNIFDCKIGSLIYGLDVPHVHIHVFPITKEIEVFQFGRTKKYLNKEAENYVKRLKFK